MADRSCEASRLTTKWMTGDDQNSDSDSVRRIATQFIGLIANNDIDLWIAIIDDHKFHI